MSKLGRENFSLQEQAEELGFESVQEALDNDYFALIEKDESKLIPKDEWELKKAHEAWCAERDTIVAKLEMLINDTPYKVYKDTLKETIAFIKRGEV